MAQKKVRSKIVLSDIELVTESVSQYSSNHVNIKDKIKGSIKEKTKYHRLPCCEAVKLIGIG